MHPSEIPLDEELIIQTKLEELSKKFEEMLKKRKKIKDKVDKIHHEVKRAAWLLDPDSNKLDKNILREGLKNSRKYILTKNILREDLKRGTNYVQEIIKKYPIYQEKMAKSLTSRITADQEGRAIIAGKNCRRYYRSFRGDREKQILRHMATQLFLALEKDSAPGLVEVQVMHICCKNKHNLFIAANKVAATASFSKVITKENFQELLTKPYAGRTDEGTVRSKRYASKLKKRVFGKELKMKEEEGFEEDSKNAKAVGKILRLGNVLFKKISYEKSNSLFLNENSEKLLKTAINQSDNIYFIDIADYEDSERHAEQFLCDIAEYIRKQHKDVYFCIAGKKRPCLGCSSRLKAAEISNYGQFPGRLWLNTIKNQPEKATVEMLKLLDKGLIFTSYRKDKKTAAIDYDSGFDSSSSEREDNNNLKQRCKG